MPSIGTYGLGAAAPAPARAPNLQQTGQRKLDQGMSLLGAAASQDQRRSMANQEQEQEAKAGNAQLGGTVGAVAGSAWGPVGTMVGGNLGSMLGGMF